MIKDVPSQSDLIRWLHVVECAAPRRFAGLLTESYFSRQLRKSRKYKNVAEGWAYIGKDRRSGPRFWFKIFQDHPKLSLAEEHFVSSLAALGHRFFSLSMIATVIGAQRLPNLEPKVGEFSKTSTGWGVFSTQGAANVQIRITKLLTVYLKNQVHGRLNASINDELPFKPWLENFGIPELQTLFSQRCFMNCRNPSPLDLDAVAETHDGKLAFVEFKRKYPTNGASKPTNREISPTRLTEIAYEIENELRSVDPQNLKSATKAFNMACRKRGFTYVPRRSYGLDMAHFETLKLCSENQIIYEYYIWNSDSDASKGAFQLPDVIADLESALTNELIEKKTIIWWNRALHPINATGLTFTWGERSGAYNNRCRVQITFDAA
ncbi:hypothetical protein [Pseudoduganella sp. R-34]|uniref:hypothetical protein n=1 Tax=Pseudoduganella sp. R-34 TaxID=3404062 RepID=UPI003CF3F5FD